MDGPEIFGADIEIVRFIRKVYNFEYYTYILLSFFAFAFPAFVVQSIAGGANKE